jgi:hypothetical protein
VTPSVLGMLNGYAIVITVVAVGVGSRAAWARLPTAGMTRRSDDSQVDRTPWLTTSCTLGTCALDQGMPAEDNAADKRELERAARSPGPSSGWSWCRAWGPFVTVPWRYVAVVSARLA